MFKEVTVFKVVDPKALYLENVKFLRVSSFYSHALCIFCPPTILGDFYRAPEESPKSSADKMNRACESKDQTLEKIRTLHFPDFKF